VRSRTRNIVEAGLLIAVSLVLSRIKIFQAPYGGSVTAGAMVPLFIAALRMGPGMGIFTGAVYGLVKLAFGGTVVHPAQLLLDYPVAYGLAGLAGFFPRKPLVGVTAGILGRFAASWLSGVVFFGQYAPKGTPAAVYSFLYNGSYLGAELIISLVIVGLVYPVLSRRLRTS